MKNKSIWQNDEIHNFSGDLPNEITTDILIIGGGITGITAAYLLKNTKQNIILIDKGLIGMGITSKTTAKATYLQGPIYQTLQKKHGTKIAKQYFDSQVDAMSLLRKIIIDNHMSCDFEKSDSILFTLEKSGIARLRKEKELLESFGVVCKDVESKLIESGFKVEEGYTFHPLKYLNGLLEILPSSVSIYENVTAYQINLKNGHYTVKTSRGVIHAKDIIVACHYPFFLFPVVVPLKTYIKREFVNAAKVNNIGNYNAINIDQELHSVRFYKDYVIYGSNQQRLTSHLDYQKGYEKSRDDFKKYFDTTPEYTWMNQDIMSNDSLPLIGKIKDHLYLATAYNAWGMTNGILAACIISNLISHGYSSYTTLFAPKRFNTSLLFESFIGSFHYMKAYGQSLFQKNEPSFVTIKGISYGIVKDSSGRLHKVKLLCPHMKCFLVFNKEEHTWDCPCHGSRFDLDGNIIEGPATKKIDM